MLKKSQDPDNQLVKLLTDIDYLGKVGTEVFYERRRHNITNAINTIEQETKFNKEEVVEALTRDIQKLKLLKQKWDQILGDSLDRDLQSSTIKQVLKELNTIRRDTLDHTKLMTSLVYLYLDYQQLSLKHNKLEMKSRNLEKAINIKTNELDVNETSNNYKTVEANLSQILKDLDKKQKKLENATFRFEQYVENHIIAGVYSLLFQGWVLRLEIWIRSLVYPIQEFVIFDIGWNLIVCIIAPGIIIPLLSLIIPEFGQFNTFYLFFRNIIVPMILTWLLLIIFKVPNKIKRWQNRSKSIFIFSSINDLWQYKFFLRMVWFTT